MHSSVELGGGEVGRGEVDGGRGVERWTAISVRWEWKQLLSFLLLLEMCINHKLDTVLNLNMFNNNTFYKIYERELERSSYNMSMLRVCFLGKSTVLRLVMCVQITICSEINTIVVRLNCIFLIKITRCSFGIKNDRCPMWTLDQSFHKL